MQKQRGFVLKAIWVVIGLLAPTTVLLTSYYFRFVNSFNFSITALLVIYFLPAIILMIIFTCVFYLYGKSRVAYSRYPLDF